jgi:hypothetical protein
MRKPPKSSTNSIQVLSTAVFDNGRRGNPRISCDCVQCFGYCITDQDIAAREARISPPKKEGLFSEQI